VKLPARRAGHLWVRQAELRRSHPRIAKLSRGKRGFALLATPRSHIVISPRAFARGILAKASEGSPYDRKDTGLEVFVEEISVAPPIIAYTLDSGKDSEGSKKAGP
jgi:hypothetical protein